MKIPQYILGIILVAVVVLAVSYGGNKKKGLDEHITLDKKDKIPYGTYVAFHDLKYIFPRARIWVDMEEPGFWDSISVNRSGQAVIMISPVFNADEEEMKRMIHFAAAGNDVFISAFEYSYDADRMIAASFSRFDRSHYYSKDIYRQDDSLEVALLDPPFSGGYHAYNYPGFSMSDYFHDLNKTTTRQYGSDASGAPNFIHLQAGRGHLYFHKAPLAFSNYFLLHRNNIEYFEKAFSVIDPSVTRVLWNEYYLFKKTPGGSIKKQGWFSALMKYPSFRAAFLTAIALLLLFTLFEMRRKQRFIPVYTKPRNDSLDFVKTIGRLYFDKGDHWNLCMKMASYFLEHVRSKYKLATGLLDDAFIRNLQYKSGAGESLLREIVSFIHQLNQGPVVSRDQLTGFYKQLEEFYKTT
jgi:hypothetical protein